MSTDSDKRPRRPAASLLGDRSVEALERTLRSEVIPRLVRAHRAHPDGREPTPTVAPGPGDADRFLLELLADQAPTQYPTVEMLLAEGADLEAMCLGLFGPAGVPRDVVHRLSTEMIRIIERPESREWLQHQGAEPAPGTPEQLAERVRSDVARIKKLLADTHLKLN